MAEGTILQHPVAQNFIYPFLLIFFIVFAVLEKTKALGDDKKQLNALLSFVIGIIFVSAVSPKMVVQDLILFLTVAMVVMFVVLILWGFVSGKEMKAGDNGSILENDTLKKWVVGIIIVSVVVVLLTSLGVSGGGVISFLFSSSWSGTFWTNFLFVAVIGVALAVVLNNTGGSS